MVDNLKWRKEFACQFPQQINGKLIWQNAVYTRKTKLTYWNRQLTDI